MDALRAVGSTVGAGASSLAGGMPSFLGGPTGSLASGLTSLANLMPSANAPTPMDVGTGGGLPSTPITESTLLNPDAAAGVNPVWSNPTTIPASPGSSGAGTSGLFSGWGPGATGRGSLQSLIGTPGAALGTAGALTEAINKWMIQRNLQNPANVAAGAQQLYQPMSKAMRRAIIGPVTAAAQETGQINAPGLYSQAVATALAPYQQQMEENALREYIASQQAAAGVWPSGGIFGASGLVPASTYGGQQAQAQQQAPTS